MDKLLKRLQTLPKTRVICEGGIIASPRVLYGADGLPFTANILMWTAAANNGVWSMGVVLDSEKDILPAFVETLGEFIKECLDNQAYPHQLRVACPKLAEYVFERLRHIGIEVHLANSLPWYEAALHTFSTELGSPLNLTDISRVTRDPESAIFGAPTLRSSIAWRQLTECEVFEIESLDLDMHRLPCQQTKGRPR